MNLIFVSHLLDVESDRAQDGGGEDGLLIKNPPVVSLPDVSQRDEDYDMGRCTRLLTVSDGVKVEGKERMFDVLDTDRRPKKLCDGILPYKGFRRARE